MKIKNKNSWYTILVTLMIIGFLIVLTIWVLNLVLREMKDNIWAWKYLQVYAWAEAAMELALLDIKKHWYWVYSKLDWTDNNAKILRNDMNNDKEILISYDLNSKTKWYFWNLDNFEQSVIPLFYIKTDDSIDKINNLNLKILNSLNFIDNTKMAWNIVSKNWDWIWWVWEITSSTKGKWRNADGTFLDEIKVSDFLNTYENNYLIVINLDNFNPLNFEITSTKDFTKPISKIISSAKIGQYKQNLETILDNTAFLSILKYSVFSQ